MADVFVSYSRRDAAFVRRLVDGLAARGKDVWIDVEGIRDAEVFPAALRSAIEASDGFLFIISPDSLRSGYCVQEVAHAVETGKRIVPVDLGGVGDEDVPEPIRLRNWIPARGGDVEAMVERIVGALDADLDHLKDHTRWELKALEWGNERRDKAFLLRGSELVAAERWLVGAEQKDPQPTPLQREYLLASRESTARRQRAVVALSLAVAVVAVALLAFALIQRSRALSQRSQARSARTTNRSRALAFESIDQQGVDPERALLIATEALRTRATADALLAVREALDADVLRARLPALGDQQCATSIGPPLSYDPTRPRLFEGRCDGTLEVVDLRTHRVVGAPRPARTVGALAHTRNGSLLAVGGEHEVVLLDTSLAVVRRIRAPGEVVNALAFSADGRQIAATSNDTGSRSWISAWATRSGRREMNYASPSSGGFYSALGVAFLPGGRRLVAGSLPGAVVFTVATGRPVQTLPKTDGALQVTLSGDGRRLAVLAFPFSGPRTQLGTVTLWDTARLDRGNVVASIAGVEPTAADLNFDGSKVAIGWSDGTAGLWSAATRRQIGSFLGPAVFVGGISFSGNGRQVAVGTGDGSVRLWRAGGAEQDYFVGGFKIATTRPALAGGILTFPLDPNRVESWRVRGFRRRANVITAPASAQSTSAAITDDGRFGAAPLNDGRVVVWDLRRHRRLRTVNEGSYAVAALSRDGRRLATFPGRVGHVYDLARIRPLRLVARGARCPSQWRVPEFSPDSHYVAAGAFCGDAFAWDARRGRLSGRTRVAGQVTALAIAPDDRTIAIGSSDSTITLWDRLTNRRAILAGHSRTVQALGFSRDGTLLVSGSLDSTVRLWDARTHKMVRLLRLDGAATVRFSADGRHLVTAERGGVFRIFDVCPFCGDPKRLLLAAERTATRRLTPVERQTYLSGF